MGPVNYKSVLGPVNHKSIFSSIVLTLYSNLHSSIRLYFTLYILIGVVCIAFVSNKPVQAIEMVDPSLEWSVLTTEHFEIIYHSEMKEVAFRVRGLVEEVHSVVSRELEWAPKGRTRIVLIDRQDSPNGYATPIPYRTIVLYPVPPDPTSSLQSYQDWMRTLLIHEYTHIVHLDMRGGLPKGLHALFGTIINPNALLPRWMIEGLATYLETKWAPGGRGQSSYTDMFIRMAALEGRFPRLDEAEGYGSEWPGGRTAYLFGVAFHQWMEERYGGSFWTKIAHRNARFFLPYLPGFHVWRETRHTLAQLWKEWTQEAQRMARKIAVNRSIHRLTPLERLSDPEGQVQALRYGPDASSIIYSETYPDRAPALIDIDLETGIPTLLVRHLVIDGISLSAENQRIFFSASTRRQRYDSHGSIYVYHRRSGHFKPIPDILRGRLPDIAPNGSPLIFIRHTQGESRLVRLKSNGDLEVLQGLIGVHSPRFSPDGDLIAMDIRLPNGNVDIYLFEKNGRLIKRLTNHPGIDAEPTFSPDGRFILFTSDRDGIHNLYAVEYEHGTLFKVTNVLGGAFQPSVSPTSDFIALRGYDARGFHLYRIPYNPESWPIVQSEKIEDVLRMPGIHAPEPLDVRMDLTNSSFGWKSTCTSSNGSFEADESQTGQQPWGHTCGRKIGGSNAHAGNIPTPGMSSIRNGLAGKMVDSDPLKEAGTNEKQNNEPPARQKKTAAAIECRASSDRCALQPQPYHSWDGLLPPRFIAPEAYLTEGGYQIGVSSFGNDVLSKNKWVASLSYRTDNEFIGYKLGYSNQMTEFPLSASIAVFSVNYGTLDTTNDFGGQAFLPNQMQGSYKYDEVRTRLSFGIEWPFSSRAGTFESSVFLAYRSECREPLFPIPGEDDGRRDNDPLSCLPPLKRAPYYYNETSIPARGRFSGVTLNYRLHALERYRRSISLEDGYFVQVNGQFQSHLFGGDYDRTALTAEFRLYESFPEDWPPWMRSHVLALRSIVGLAFGETPIGASFRLGGHFGDGSAILFPDEYYPLRGYPIGALQGEAFLLANLEYRMPIWYINRGFGTLPLFLEDLNTAFFLDAGSMGESDSAFRFPSINSVAERTRVGIGVEMRVHMIIGYGLPFSLRGGFSLGTAANGFRLSDSEAWYIQMGSYY